MGISPLNPLVNIAGGYLQSLLAPGSSPSTSTATGTSASGAAANGQPVSPFAQVLNSLQQLQQANASRFSQLTQQIATNLQSASQTAQANGNATIASELNTLAGDFSNASTNGQLPNVLDLAKAIGGHHHHHCSGAAANSNVASTTGTATTGTTASNPTPDMSALLSQLYGSFQTGGQTGGTLNASTDPQSIILNTLSTAGI